MLPSPWSCHLRDALLRTRSSISFTGTAIYEELSLKKGPAGMVIDKSTGMITWRVTEKEAGKHPVSVLVSDGQGGDTLYNYDVTLGVEK